MAKFKFKKKEPLSYVDAHNKAVNRYQKSSFFLVWIGVVNLLSAIIGAFQTINDPWPSSNFSMSLSVQLYLDAVLTVNLGGAWGAILIVLTSAALGAVFAVLGTFASKGYKIPLFVGTALYLADASLIFYLFNQTGELLYNSGILTDGEDLGWTAYAFMIATHLVILFFLVVAIFYYFQVLTIEKKHRGASKVVFTPKDETVVIAESKEEKDNSTEEKKNG